VVALLEGEELEVEFEITIVLIKYYLSQEVEGKASQLQAAR